MLKSKSKSWRFYINILHNNENWIVVNKPSGLSVHNNEDATNLLTELDAHGFKGFSPVNRLDKETSGIMILSLDGKMTAKLQAALSANSSMKEYLAIVKGVFPEDKRQGSWKQNLTNKAEGKLNPLGIKKDRVSCVTNYKVLAMSRYLSLLQLEIETGRQHQIRKHCVVNSHQIVGDVRYGDKKFNTLIQAKYSFSNMALHSYKLSFLLDDQEYKFIASPPDSWGLLQLGTPSSE